jgi:steroid delta-isomerase-like uncharacterized protein
MMITYNTLHLEIILAELMDAWNAHDADRVASFYAPDYIGTDAGEPGQQRGPVSVRQTVQHFLDAFPDLTLLQDQAIICDENAAIQITVRGTHRGSIMNIPATGRRTVIQGVAFLKFEHGRIIQASYLWDVAGFLRSIGLLPDL